MYRVSRVAPKTVANGSIGAATDKTMFDKTDTLTADLDLLVSYPGGSRSSLTNDNNYEFVGFTAPSSGTVTVNVSKARFDASLEYWGLAWLHY